MFSRVKKIFLRNSSKHSESSLCTKSLLFVIIANILEDVLFWKKMWLSLLFIFYFHLFFLVCFYRQFNVLQIICGFSMTIVIVDAFEAWLKYKHRMSCLKRLAAPRDNSKLSAVASKTYIWLKSLSLNLIDLRLRNSTKAFLLMEIFFGIIFITGRYINGFAITYILFMVLMSLNKLLPLLEIIVKKIQETADCDLELEGLVPDSSAANLKLLSIETEVQPIFDDKQSLDCWKPEDLLIEDASDSSDNSSSLVTNLSMEKLQTLVKDVDETDSSEDEYIPQGQQHEQFRSSMEVQPVGTWSSSAYNIISSLSGAVTNIVYNPNEEKKRKRVSSIDSSDGFEMVDKNDIM